jgi:hypothetical protein
MVDEAGKLETGFLLRARHVFIAPEQLPRRAKAVRFRRLPPKALLPVETEVAGKLDPFTDSSTQDLSGSASGRAA